MDVTTATNATTRTNSDYKEAMVAITMIIHV
jgi:hypothetical protein